MPEICEINVTTSIRIKDKFKLNTECITYALPVLGMRTPSMVPS